MSNDTRDFFRRNLILNGLIPEDKLNDGTLPVSPKALHELYESSTVYRAIIDFVAYGVANSDLDAMMKYNPQLEDYPEALQSWKEEYRKVSRLIYSALTGKKFPEPKDQNVMDDYAMKVTEALPHLAQSIIDRKVILNTVQALKANLRECNVSSEMARTIHALTDTVISSRNPANDITHALRLAEAMGIPPAIDRGIA